jgi:tRNA (pseudouridine54-N1)-methyltransferase
MPADVSPGVTIRRLGIADTLDRIETEGTVVQLHQDGKPVTESSPPSDPVFVLSDHQDFQDAETELLEAAADERLCIGPERVHANHAITVVNNWLDTSGYEAY